MWTVIAKALGELFGPIFREILPQLLEFWRSPPDGKRIETTLQQEQTTEKINEAWDEILQQYDLPPDYLRL